MILHIITVCGEPFGPKSMLESVHYHAHGAPGDDRTVLWLMEAVASLGSTFLIKAPCKFLLDGRSTPLVGKTWAPVD